MIEDLRPSFARFDLIDATTNGSGTCWYRPRNVLSFGFSFVAFLVLVFTIIKCGLKRCAKKSGLTRMCQQVTHTQDPDTLPPTQSSAPDSCEAMDMEAEMSRHDRDLHNPKEVLESNHYSTPN